MYVVVEVQYMNKPAMYDKKHGGTINYIKEYLMEDVFVDEKDEKADRTLLNEIKNILKEFDSIYSIKFFIRQNLQTLNNLKKEEIERLKLLAKLKGEEAERKSKNGKK